MTGRTKIVATIGPASDSLEALGQLIDAGADVMRLNLSHGTLDEHLAVLARIRAVAADRGQPVAVLADLPGPKVRAGAFPDGGVVLGTGTIVELVSGDGPSDDRRIQVDYPTLLDDLTVDARVQLGDGAIALRVVEVGSDSATARIETGGEANGRPGVHLASDRLRLPSPTAHDLVLAEAVAAAGVEFVAVSFVRSPGDIDQVRAVVGDRAQIVAKMETRASVEHLHEIIAATDVVMVARGDLGIDCPIEDVPHLQKRIIRHCVEAGVPVITATQMLESMITAPSPTPRRGERCGERGLRRHRRRDAVRRDGDRPRSGSGRAHDGDGLRARRVGGVVPAVGRPARTDPAPVASRADVEHRSDHRSADPRGLTSGK